MDISRIAPIVRGIALSRAAASGGNPAAFVVSREASSHSVPAGAIALSLAGADEAAMVAAMTAGLAMAPGLPFLLVLGEGQDRLLFAAAATIAEARALIDGTKAGDATTDAATASAATAPLRASHGGCALQRSHVVEGKVALVTGGAQGFGEEIVRGLVASGAVVWVADMNAAGAERLAAELNTAAGRTAAIPLAIDVSSEDSVRSAFATVAAATGGLDLVVSNAGVLKAGAVLEQDAAAFEFVTRVNYTGFFLVTKYAGQLLRLQHLACPGWRTDIVQINSKSGLAGSNKNGAYAGSKFGGIGLVQSFALELVEYGIKVNAICPGNFFDGPLWSHPENGLFVQYLRTGKVPGAKSIADVKAFYEAKVPMGRGCEGPDVMRALYYLIEQEYETGQALPVTGGQVMLN